MASLASQYCHGLARLRWTHCESCHAKLDYQTGSIMWDVMERAGDGHRCAKCEAGSIAKGILANLRQRLRAMPKV